MLADVEKLTLADVKRFYEAYYNPTNAKVVVTGDVTAQQVESGLAFLTQWQGPVPRPWGSQAQGRAGQAGHLSGGQAGAPGQ